MQTRRGRTKSSPKASQNVLLHLRTPTPSQTHRHRAPWSRHSRRSPWIKVRTQFRPQVRTQPRTFFDSGKSAKTPPVKASSTAPGECEDEAPEELGRSLQDLQRRHDPEELECQRDLLLETLLNFVSGRNLEGLHDRHVHHNFEELECQRSAPLYVRLNPVLDVTLEDLTRRHDRRDHEELECRWSALAVCCWREAKDTIVGTSTNWSAVCG